MGNLERSEVEHNFVRTYLDFTLSYSSLKLEQLPTKILSKIPTGIKRIELWAKSIGADTRNGARLPSAFSIMAPGSAPC